MQNCKVLAKKTRYAGQPFLFLTKTFRHTKGHIRIKGQGDTCTDSDKGTRGHMHRFGQRDRGTHAKIRTKGLVFINTVKQSNTDFRYLSRDIHPDILYRDKHPDMGHKSGHLVTNIRTWDTNPDIFGQGDISTL